MPVKERLFWIVAIVLMGAAIHLAFVLFLPNYAMGRKFEVMRELAGGDNQFKVLSRDQAARYLVESDEDLVHGVCSIDLQGAPVRINAPVPAHYWSMNIYSERGDSIYTVNDLQVKADRFAVEIRRGEDQPAGAGETASTGGDENLARVTSQQRFALLVVRARAPTRQARRDVAKAIAASECKKRR